MKTLFLFFILLGVIGIGNDIEKIVKQNAEIIALLKGTH